MRVRGVAKGLGAASGLALMLAVVLPAAAQQPTPAPTQTQAPTQLQAPGAGVILTIDSDRLFLGSDFGKRVVREIEDQGNALAAENRRIEAELAQAEQDLTDRRAGMSAAEFRPLADAFDARVQETRQAQALKSRNLNALLEQERELFLSAAGPIFQELMQEVGATVVLERRGVFFSSNSSDITSAAIARLNARLGDGQGAEAPARE